MENAQSQQDLSSGRKRQSPLCLSASSHDLWQAVLALARPPQVSFHTSSMNFILCWLLFLWHCLSVVWMSERFLPVPSLYPVFQILSFISWHISKSGSALLRPSHPTWLALGSSSFRSCFSQGHRQLRRHMGSKSLWGFLKRAISSTALGEDCNNQFQTELPGSTRSAEIPVWLTEADSIGFWYETFQWHKSTFC